MPVIHKHKTTTPYPIITTKAEELVQVCSLKIHIIYISSIILAIIIAIIIGIIIYKWKKKNAGGGEPIANGAANVSAVGNVNSAGQSSTENIQMNSFENQSFVHEDKIKLIRNESHIAINN